MHTLLLVTIQALLVVLLAEFVAGLVHWFEDAYVREDTPLIGNLIGRPNVIHHHLPRHMTHNNWWQSSWDALLVSAIIVLVAWALDSLTWHVWLFAVLSANANEFHKWAHRTRRENGRIISWLQDIRLLQTPQHHALHHTNPKNVRYCVVTNALNPLLDGARFWEALEWLLARTINLHRRPDTSLPGNGIAPAWLDEVRHRHAPVQSMTACQADGMGAAGIQVEAGSHQPTPSSQMKAGTHISTCLSKPLNSPRWLCSRASRFALLSLCLGLCAGCRATSHVVSLSQPRLQPRAHTVFQLHEAAATTDGRLLLRATGKAAGSSKASALSIALPLPDRSRGSTAQRVMVPPTAVQMAGQLEVQGMESRRLPVGPPIIFTSGESYNWDRLRPVAGQGQEVRLVRRLGETERWEVVHLDIRADGDCWFTVFEAQPTQVTVRYRSALALVPLAMAADVVAVGAMVSGPIVFGAACLPAGRPEGLALMPQMEPWKQLGGQ